MANGNTDEKKGKQMMRKQKEEMEEITENFKSFFEEHQDLTAEELKSFVKSQAEEAESGKVKSDLMKRLSAIEKIQGVDQLTGEDLKTELNNLSTKFHDDMEILSESITKGNELLSSGFSKMTGVLRDSFGPVFDLVESGGGVLTGIYETMIGAFTLMRGIPSLLGSMGGYFKRKEKREMRETATGGQGFIAQILKGIGILGVGIIGAFTLFTENVTKQFLSAFTTVGKILRTVFINPITRFLSKFKIGRGILSVFSKIGSFFKYIFTTGSRISKGLQIAAKSAGPITKIFARIAGLITKIGGLAGRIFLPIMVIYEVVKGLFSEGTIRDKILSASAGVLSIFTKIPQMIANALLDLFGFEFRLDLGKDAIIDAVNTLTEWAEKPIHAILDFFTKTIPEVFGSAVDAIKGIIPSGEDIKKGIANNIPDFVPDGAIPKGAEGGKGKEEASPGEVPEMQKGGLVKREGLAYVHPAEITMPADLSNKIMKLINEQDTDSISKYENEKIRLYKQIRDYLKSLTESYQEQARAAQTRGNETERVDTISEKKDPPDEIESMGLLFSNKSWGLG